MEQIGSSETMSIDSLNKIGESVNSLEVGSSSGSLDVRVKYENKK
jgi:hypothetical protein